MPLPQLIAAAAARARSLPAVGRPILWGEAEVASLLPTRGLHNQVATAVLHHWAEVFHLRVAAVVLLHQHQRVEMLSLRVVAWASRQMLLLCKRAGRPPWPESRRWWKPPQLLLPKSG